MTADAESYRALRGNPPIWPFRAIIATSFLVLTLQVVAEILKCVETLRRRDAAGGEARP